MFKLDRWIQLLNKFHSSLERSELSELLYFSKIETYSGWANNACMARAAGALSNIVRAVCSEKVNPLLFLEEVKTLITIFQEGVNLKKLNHWEDRIDEIIDNAY